MPLASAQLAGVLAEVRAGLRGGYGETLRAVIAILALPEHPGSGT